MMTSDYDCVPDVLPCLYERDIDVLICEEVIFNSQLVLLIQRALGISDRLEVVSSQLSVVDSVGETDINVDAHFGGTNCSILIENKIGAAFQPRQPERYNERVGNFEKAGLIAYAILVAPKAYIDRRPSGLEQFNCFLDYEQIAVAIRAGGGHRGQYRASLLLRAVEQAKRAYQLVPSERVTSFWVRVFEIASSEFPQLKMASPRDKGGNSNWIVFKGGLPSRIQIDWKITKSVVELYYWDGNEMPSFAGQEARLAGLVQAQVVQSGQKGKVVQLQVSPGEVDFTELTDAQIREALAAASALQRLYLERLASRGAART